MALALAALKDVTSRSNTEHRHDVSFSYLLEVLSMSTRDMVEILDMLRQPAVASAMWACLEEPNPSSLGFVAPLLKKMLGGYANPNLGGLEIDDEEFEQPEDYEDVRIPPRVMLQEFFLLGGGRPFGEALSAVAGMLRLGPGRQDEARRPMRATVNDMMIHAAEVSLRDCITLMCTEGEAGKALRQHLPANWPSCFIKGHVDLLITVSRSWSI